jgi:hypothetical protein
MVLTYTLIELPIPPPHHGGVVTAVYFGNVVPLDVTDLVHG